MKTRNSLPELSKSELDIMKGLWKDGRLSAREVHDNLCHTYKWAYSTTETAMKILRSNSKGGSNGYDCTHG
ncbi:MAG: BlaI/MecI/CopY family transcriptional regulator [bacterium]